MPRPVIANFVGQPLFAVILSLLAIVIGLVGSAFQTQIASAFPLVLTGPWGPLSIPASIFWGALLLLGYGLWLRQRADDVARAALNAATLRIETATGVIQTAVQTLPERTFLAEVANSALGVRGIAFRNRTDSRTSQQLSADVRTILRTLASLAASYDEKWRLTKDVVYTANVFIAVNVLADQDWKAVTFMDPARTADVDRLLRLRSDFQATNLEAAPVGVAVSDLLQLPVPRKGADDHWRRVALPGAPITYLDGASAGYDDTATLAAWCRSNGAHSEAVLKDLDDYFRSGVGREIRSFISTPLVTLERRRFGVANIHANATAVLQGDRRHNFLAIAAPMLMDLTETVTAVLEAELREAPQGSTLQSGTSHG